MSQQIEFPFAGRRRIRAVFDAGPISSDGGALLLRQVDRKIGLLAAMAEALPDGRDARYVKHATDEMLRQRIFGIALGYEDCNDATTLRGDPLASQPTLLDNYFRRHPRRPSRLVLDVDLTNDPTHGPQELSAFHGFYDQHLYLPLLVYDQEGDLLTAVLLPGKDPGPQVAVAVLERIVPKVRARWPELTIIIRADSGFAAPALYALCEEHGLGFIVGLQPNVRLKKLTEGLQEKARRRYLRTGGKARLFSSMRYRARRRWPRSYRVLVKAEHQAAGPNVRFVVTNLSGPAQPLYDDEYVARGESCENSIKDLKNALKADRLSCHRFWANQFRLLLHAAAYVLMFALRRAAAGTELAEVQMDTLRLRLLKIGVRVESTARRVWFHLSSSHPWQRVWAVVARRVAESPMR